MTPSSRSHAYCVAFGRRQQSPAARVSSSRGVVDGEELTLKEGDCCLLPKATQYAWELEEGVMMSVANAFT